MVKKPSFHSLGMIQSCLDGDADDDPIWEEHWVYLKMPPESTGILMISLACPFKIAVGNQTCLASPSTLEKWKDGGFSHV